MAAFKFTMNSYIETRSKDEAKTYVLSTVKAASPYEIINMIMLSHSPGNFIHTRI